MHGCMKWAFALLCPLLRAAGEAKARGSVNTALTCKDNLASYIKQ